MKSKREIAVLSTAMTNGAFAAMTGRSSFQCITKGLAALLMAFALVFGFASCSSDSDSEKEKVSASEPATNALSSLKAVDGFSNVFTVEYDGEYYLSDAVDSNLKTASELLSYLTKNIPAWKTAKESGAPLTINVSGAACSSIVAENATAGTSGYIYGRNFDWAEGSAIIVHTRPDNAYESVSTCHLGFITNDPEWTPSSDAEHDAVVLGSIYVPMDGMNEKGLYIANLQNDTEPTMQSAEGKKYVQTTVAIRYVLDKAATVEEALSFLKGINMCAVYAEDPEMVDYHFAIADNSGKSVVVEWIDGEMKTVESKIVTNHSLVNQHDDTDHGTFRRFESLKAEGEAANWKMTSSQIAASLEKVQQKHSVWSAVFEPGAKRITYYFRKASITDENKSTPIDYTKPVVVQF